MKRISFTLSLIFAATLLTSLNAQIKEVGNFMAGGTNDAKTLMKAYLSPYANALGADLSAGWYNTAKPHKLGGFDLTVNISTAFVPSADKEFNLKELGLQNMAVASTSNGISPTAAGKASSGPRVDVYAPEFPTTSLAHFNAPQGTGLSFVPAPMIQLGVGLIKGTEVVGRYCPTINYGKGGKFGMWGVGIKHSISQWIPVVDKIPFLNISFMGGYTKLNSSNPLSVSPSDLGMANSYPTVDFSNQKLDFVTEALTANIVASADLPFITFYGGVGINNSKTDLDLKGNFPVPVDSKGYIKDPVSMSIKNSDGSTMKPRLNAGFKLKMAVLHIHFDYTYANYSIFSTGFGISFR
jgi:hypothetical protein